MINSSDSTKVQSLDSSLVVPGIGGLRKLQADIILPAEIAEQDRAMMFLLMRKYYADITSAQFERDLSEKDAVIILRDPAGVIQGFSTLLNRMVKTSRGSVRTVFSGDTVVEKEYWGSKDLGVAFLKYLFLQKVKQPFQPLYWMLMSKGYKTYLLMANNFREHYPRYEERTPAHIQDIMNAFYGEKFGASYDARTGIITPHDCRLREGVAAVTDELRRKVPRIEFFASKNPRWADGYELACIAEMTLFMPLYYSIKKIFSRKGKK
jgi:hypothetical protein